MLLHLIRHPRPQLDAGICYGRLDVAAPLESGLVDRLRQSLPSGLPLWSSPLRRCRDLAAALHPQPIFDGRLREMNFGAWEGQAWDDIPRAELDAWAADVADFAPPEGESPRAVQLRALAFVAGLSVPEAIVVTHAGVIRCLLAHSLGLPAVRWSELQFPYGSCTRWEVARDSR